MEKSGIPIVDYVWFTDKQWFAQRDKLIEEIETRLGYPVIVKPANLGSSVGISHADNREELIAKVDVAEKYSTRIVIEDMVEELKEINCSVLGDCDDYRTSVCEEPIKSGDILTYEDKYMGGGKSNKGMQATQKRIPADLSPEDTARVQFLAGETFRVLSCHGVARVDFMIDGKSGVHLCQRNQHHSRFPLVLPMGSLRHTLRPAYGQISRPRLETQTRVFHEDRQLRPKHFQPRQRAERWENGRKTTIKRQPQS